MDKTVKRMMGFVHLVAVKQAGKDRTVVFSGQYTNTTVLSFPACFTATRWANPIILLTVLSIQPRIRNTKEQPEKHYQECEPRTFGKNCLSHCYCFNGQNCQKDDGICPPGGCEAGWKGQNCSVECEPRTFGKNCLSRCYCFNGQNCQKDDGICPPGGCEAGWKGQNCSVECDERTFGKNCLSHCYCFNGQNCQKDDGNCPPGGCEAGWKGQNCSVECEPRTFGKNCLSRCYCFNGQNCQKDDGICPPGGCEAGWKGQNCSVECDERTFGKNCLSHCYCFNGQNCQKDDGNCPPGGCEAGWKGQNCSVECEPRTFGKNCLSRCYCFNGQNCQKDDGICPPGGCEAGWKGQNCSVECEPRTFGKNCLLHCHCFNGQHCQKDYGICPPGGCEAGWKGQNCSVACESPTFGQNCSSICHCFLNESCDYINGSCTSGVCSPGWQGENCSLESDRFEQNENGGLPIATIVVPVFCIVIVAGVAAGVLFYRKRKSRKASHKSSRTFTNIQEPESERKQITLSSTETVLNTQNSIQENDNSQVLSDNLYYSFSTKANAIFVRELWEYINLAKLDNCEKIYQEFQKLPVGLIFASSEARRKENIKKNRYKGIFPYDHSRVVLGRTNPNNSTYINACYIDGFKRPNQFIAAQGPQESTVDDFWEMVIQEKSSVIVILTNVIESGVRKCTQYWPIEENEEIQFADIIISTLKIETFHDYIIRELEITKAGKKTMRVTQAHFTAWPDKDVPDEAWHLVNFWKKVRTLNGSMIEPIIVHCSAGIGRTGTFIALDILFEQACAEEFIQPLDIVTKMRHQRMNMVQTKDQYLFLYEAVAEALHLGIKPIQTRDFDAMYTSLLQTFKSSNLPGLKRQFQLVQEKNPAENESEYCNVFPVKESDEYRPKLASSLTVGQYGMCHIQNYDGKNMFLTITSQLQDGQLSSLVLKHGVKTIVSLHNRNEGEKKSGKNWNIGAREESVKLQDVNREKDFVENTFEIMESNIRAEDRLVRQFVYLKWHEGASTPSDSNSILDLLNAVQRWQPEFAEDHPIVIHCEAENDQAGLICALLCEFERIRMKDEVNILATVKNMKKINPRFIPDYAQYEFLYSTILEYIRQSDVYVNL